EAMAGRRSACRSAPPRRRARPPFSRPPTKPSAASPYPEVTVTQLLPHPGDGHPAELAGEPIGEDDAEAYISGICFKTGPPGRVGVELEWLVQDRADPTRRVPHDLVTAAAAAAVVRYGTLSVEPGGQLEYSSVPGASLDACIEATREDVAALRAAVGGAGVRLAGHGVDPYRSPQRVLDAPRYAA